jgi:hypothetical protein
MCWTDTTICYRTLTPSSLHVDRWHHNIGELRPRESETIFGEMSERRRNIVTGLKRVGTGYKYCFRHDKKVLDARREFNTWHRWGVIDGYMSTSVEEMNLQQQVLDRGAEEVKPRRWNVCGRVHTYVYSATVQLELGSGTDGKFRPNDGGDAKSKQ